MSSSSLNRKPASFTTALSEPLPLRELPPCLKLSLKVWTAAVLLPQSAPFSCTLTLTLEDRTVLSRTVRHLLADDSYFTDIRDRRCCESLLARLSS